jgi:hypothetical protein
LKQIKKDSLENIENERESNQPKSKLFKLGLKMAFWTHQFTNAERNLAKIQNANSQNAECNLTK